MNAAQQLLTEHLDIWSAADTEKKSGRGRASNNAGSVYGIRKLRALIMGLAVRGKLVPQDAKDEPAVALLKRIQAEKAKLIEEGKIKKGKPLAPITVEEMPYELPHGWEWARLDNFVLSILSGGTPSKNKSDFWNGDIPWASVKDLNVEKFLESTQDYITKAGLDAGSKLANKGDLLICTRMGLGKIAIAAMDVAINQDLKALKISPQLDIDYFMNFYSTLKIVGSGMTVAGIKQDELLGYCVPTPPLAEQHRIVAKVDELMALCDQLETQHANAAEAHEKLVSHLLATLTQARDAADFNARWQRIVAHFDTLFTTESSIDALKQTLLQLAVMGKLVPQAAKDEPASELLKRIQVEKAKLIAEGRIKKDKPLAAITDDEKLFDLPPAWEWVRLGDVSSTVQYGYTDSANHLSKKVLFLRITDIQDDTVDWATVPGCDISLSDSDNYMLENNDIVIARTGGTIGKSYLVSGLNQKAVFASYLIRVGNLSTTSEQYKKIFLGSKLYWTQLIASSMGTGQPNVNGTALKNLIFTLPPITEQHRIVAKVDELMALCDQLKSRITKASQLQQKLADVMVEQVVV